MSASSAEDAELAAATVLPVSTAALATAPLPAEKVIAGDPIEGNRVLATSTDVEVGLWELTASTSSDVEVDEVFIVVSGRATLIIAPDGERAATTLELEVGSIVRLSAGMTTVWHVHETLRKLYVAL